MIESVAAVVLVRNDFVERERAGEPEKINNVQFCVFYRYLLAHIPAKSTDSCYFETAA